DPALLEVLNENGYTESTELEKLCIPRIKSGRDMMCIAGDGSGKTTTIVVSILNKLKASFADVPRAIVIVPTKEAGLAMKAEVALLGQYTDLRVHTAFEVRKIDDQKDKIYMGSDVVIGTPKRLNLIYSLYALNLNSVKIFAIDDAELVIKNINYPQIDRLSESMPKAQKVVFGSQFTEWLDRFSNEFMNIQEVIEVEEPDGEEIESSE
ncbi:MAG TPA: DEAD/DEAH box helicase, partial [Prolixibacteraceae bacterium]|nr:DEAD/DEAH box helicase [Prolixibacteraceae bacterium]